MNKHVSNGAVRERVRLRLAARPGDDQLPGTARAGVLGCCPTAGSSSQPAGADWRGCTALHHRRSPSALAVMPGTPEAMADRRRCRQGSTDYRRRPALPAPDARRAGPPRVRAAHRLRRVHHVARDLAGWAHARLHRGGEHVLRAGADLRQAPPRRGAGAAHPRQPLQDGTKVHARRLSHHLHDPGRRRLGHLGRSCARRAAATLAHKRRGTDVVQRQSPRVSSEAPGRPS